MGRPTSVVLTEHEFLSLPSSIQRKCFSSLERLHIAYSSTLPKEAPDKCLSPQPASSRLAPPSFRRSKAAAFDDTLFSRAQAQWFYSLPDKIRRQHFSAEEHDSIIAGLEHSRGIGEFGAVRRISAIQDRRTSTTSLPPNMDSRAARPQLTLLQSQLRSSTSSHHTLIGSPTSPHHRRGRSNAGTLVSLPRPSIDSVAAADGEAVYYRNPEARSKLRQYLASPQKFDEALTYGFPSSPQPDEEAGDPSRSPPPSSNNDAKAFLQGDVISFIDGLEIDLEAPEDEAGSEAASEPDTDSPSTPGDADWSWRTSKYNRLSIFGGLDTDSLPSLSLNAYQSPPAARRPPPTSPAPAMPSRSPLLLYDPAFLPAPGATNLPNREMTLRMTLTRPDLRANDEQLYGWQTQQQKSGPLQHLQQLQQRRGSSASIVRHQQLLHQRREQEHGQQQPQRKSSMLAEDPLALEELPPLPDDPSGARGAFAIEALPRCEQQQQQHGGPKLFRRLLGKMWK